VAPRVESSAQYDQYNKPEPHAGASAAQGNKSGQRTALATRGAHGASGITRAVFAKVSPGVLAHPNKEKAPAPMAARYSHAVLRPQITGAAPASRQQLEAEARRLFAQAQTLNQEFTRVDPGVSRADLFRQIREVATEYQATCAKLDGPKGAESAARRMRETLAFEGVSANAGRAAELCARLDMNPNLPPDEVRMIRSELSMIADRLETDLGDNQNDRPLAPGTESLQSNVATRDGPLSMHLRYVSANRIPVAPMSSDLGPLTRISHEKRVEDLYRRALQLNEGLADLASAANPERRASLDSLSNPDTRALSLKAVLNEYEAMQKELSGNGDWAHKARLRLEQVLSLRRISANAGHAARICSQLDNNHGLSSKTLDQSREDLGLIAQRLQTDYPSGTGVGEAPPRYLYNHLSFLTP
jgi:hypothetical protein